MKNLANELFKDLVKEVAELDENLEYAVYVMDYTFQSLELNPEDPQEIESYKEAVYMTNTLMKGLGMLDNLQGDKRLFDNNILKQLPPEKINSFKNYRKDLLENINETFKTYLETFRKGKF